MPSSVSRSCGSHLFIWLARLVAIITRRPAAPELPLSTLDLHGHNIVETASVPQDGPEHEQLVSSHWQRELGLPRHRYADELASDRRNSMLLTSAQNSHANSTKTDEFASLFSTSPTLASQSPLLTTATPPLIHMSPPPVLQSPEMCTSLLNPERAFSGDAVDPSSCSASEAPIGELGKRRGFKGAPLFTPEIARRPSLSFLSLSSAFSPKFPLSPRLSPSTPRTPLSNVTNRIRTSAARSPGRSPAKSKPLATQSDPPVSDKLQQCYELCDPFSVMCESFFVPEIVCTCVPALDLERFDVYRTAAPAERILVRHRKMFSKDGRAASRKRRETNVYDMLVYNFQPKAKAKFGKKRTRRIATSLRPILLIPTTMAGLSFSSEEPRVHLPRHFRKDWQAALSKDADLPTPVPDDFCRSSCPVLFLNSQNVLVNMGRETAPPAASYAHDHDDSSPYFLDATMYAGALPTRRRSLVLGDLLALLDVCAATPDQAEEVDGRSEPLGDRIECTVVAE